MSTKTDRKLIQLLVQSAKLYKNDLSWKHYQLDPELLVKNLIDLKNETTSSVEDEDIRTFVQQLANNTGFSVLRTDPIQIEYKNLKKNLSRQSIAEAFGTAGAHLFPTRQRAYRCAYETAREALYFGYGNWHDQFLDDPIDAIANLLKINDKTSKINKNATIFRDLRTKFDETTSVFEALNQDLYFSKEIQTEQDFIAFQENLRNNPLDPILTNKLSDFFNQHATIGLRDGIRRSLGSRHPWFDWAVAKKHIERAFSNQHDTNFNTAQLVYYLWNPELSEDEIQNTLEQNQKVVDIFAKKLKAAVAKSTNVLDHLDYQNIALWTLDIHHDYPDFDIEVEGQFGAKTHADFLKHSIRYNVRQNWFGEATSTRYNLNIRAHFIANHLFEKFFVNLTEKQIGIVFDAILSTLVQYDKHSGVPSDSGILTYNRLPCDVLVWQSLGLPDPKEDEVLLDTFDLSEMTNIVHASHLRTYPDISEKLVVFFTIVMRHMLETQHVPDLRPKDIAKDLVLLGLWGTRTENLKIHLYIDKKCANSADLVSKITRSQLKFVGMQQLESYALSDALSELREGNKFLRFCFSQFMLLVEPSVLRVLGMFTMALEEFKTGTHVQKTSILGSLNYGIDLIRETSRKVVKGSIINTSEIMELLLDKVLDKIQNNLKSNS